MIPLVVYHALVNHGDPSKELYFVLEQSKGDESALQNHRVALTLFSGHTTTLDNRMLTINTEMYELRET